MSEKPSYTTAACKECEGTGQVRVRTPSGRARMSRHKGTRGELRIAKEIARLLGVEYGDAVCRTPNSGAFIERSDLRFSDEMLRRFPVYCEVKTRDWSVDGIFTARTKWEPLSWHEEATLKYKHERSLNRAGYLLVIVVLVKRNFPPVVLWNLKSAFALVSTALLALSLSLPDAFFLTSLNVFVSEFRRVFEEKEKGHAGNENPSAPVSAL